MSRQVARVGSRLNVEDGVVDRPGQEFVTVNGNLVVTQSFGGPDHKCLESEMPGWPGFGGGGGGYKGPGDTVGPPVDPPGQGGPGFGFVPCVHSDWIVVGGASWFTIGGNSVSMVGSPTSCKHVIETGEEFLTISSKE